MSGDELEELLLSLGFSVRAGASGKHCVVTHSGLRDFYSFPFDKGHGKQMKPSYPRNAKRVLQRYQDELEELERQLGGTNGSA